VDVVGSGNTGPLLLRTPPPGAWIAETKLHLDLGVDTIRNDAVRMRTTLCE
jgi:arabinan endo-1,5-alpha-L-arabinosidase